MESLIAVILVAAGIGIWIGFKKLVRRSPPKSQTMSDNPHASLDLPATVERYPDAPRTRPTALSWRQREILSVAAAGRLIYPVPSQARSDAISDTHYYVQRLPVVALVRAGFLAYTPDGYSITDAGIDALERLPKRNF